MAADGSGINLLSFHDSNEWNPSVTHDGRIVWTRWDYVDRHGCVGARAVDHAPGRHRPARAARQLRAAAAPRRHGVGRARHSRLAPSLSRRPPPITGRRSARWSLIDPRVEDDDAMGPVRRLTPDVGFPESQGGREVYGTPWPLGENYHLCVYDAGRTGAGTKRPDATRQLRHLSGGRVRQQGTDLPRSGDRLPQPDSAAADPAGPVVPCDAKPGARCSPPAPAHDGEGTMAVVNVYNTLRPWPADTKIKELRILQLLPCSVPSGFTCRTRPASGSPKRATPSCRRGGCWAPCRSRPTAARIFKVPAYRELFFQLVDDRGMAVQSMRSGTAVRHGEKLVCQGCHEQKHQAATAPGAIPLALRRPPSEPKPDVDGSNPFSYPRLVQPVLDRNCVKCHEENKDKKAPNLAREPIQDRWFASYTAC